MSEKRKGVGKGTRFRIFARDQFTCRYCGRQSDEVKLVIDHIIPVAKGGGNDDSNLGTSCEGCNSGKAAKTLDSFAPNENERLRLSQERKEQEEAAQSAKASAESRQQIRETISSYWCDATGRSDVDRQTLSLIAGYAREFGCEMVFDWIDLAANDSFRRYRDDNMGKYISGIRRKYLLERSNG